MSIKEQFQNLIESSRKAGTSDISNMTNILTLQVALEDEFATVPEDVFSGLKEDERKIVLQAVCLLFIMSIKS